MCGQVKIMDHPLIRHKISLLRDEKTTVKDFREVAGEITLLMGYEATKDVKLKEITLQTPLAQTKGEVLEKQFVIVPILRAGLGMAEPLLKIMPAAKVGHIGLYRDHETLQPVEYYCKLPMDIADRHVLVVDPMLATGGSSAAAIGFIKQRGAKKITLMCLIAAPEGVKAITTAHPDVDVLVACLDDKLNEKGYILPGLGDAGDRLFGTL